MKFAQHRFKIITATAATAIAILFNGCSDVSFSNFTKIQKPLICDPLNPTGPATDCTNVKNGLIGEIWYFLDKDPADTIAEFVYDTLDNPIEFPEAINKVDQFYATGFLVDADILLSSLNKPSIRFSEGFREGGGNLINDANGNPLFEAFAFRLKSFLKLPADLEPGLYELGVIADDGAILKLDTNGDLLPETIVDNDGTHSTRLGCAQGPVILEHDRLVSMEVNYYQGPRNHIALVMVMRKISDAAEVGTDPLCGFASTTQWFGDTSVPGYQPDYVNSKFGELAARGWFIPTTDMFVLPN